MKRSILSLSILTAVAAAQFACSQLTYSSTVATDSLIVELGEPLTIDVFASSQMPEAERHAAEGNLKGSLHFWLSTREMEADFAVEVWDGDELIDTIEATEGEDWDDDAEDHVPDMSISYYVPKLYKGCHWGETCSRDLELVLIGEGTAEVELGAHLSMTGADAEHAGFSRVIHEIELAVVE